MGNPFGRSTIVPLTNKSGGSVAAGDLVYIDTANNDSFTTGTTSAYTKAIGIAAQTIASNAIGLVLTDGYAPLVNVNASVTRGNFLKSYTVVKQGTDAGASRVAGTCGMFLTGGTTPDAIIWQPDLGAGSGELVSASAIWTTKGQIVAATGSGAATVVTAGANGKVPVYDSAQSNGLTTAYPPGYEYNYTAKTSDTSITATSEGTANTVITASGGIALDGSTAVVVTFFSTGILIGTTFTRIVLYDDTGGGAASVGIMGLWVSRSGALLELRLTPSNATHTYSIRAYVDAGTGTVQGAAGGSGNLSPAFLRITKA